MFYLIPASLVFAIVIYFVIPRRKSLYIFIRTLPRDIKIISRFIKFQLRMRWVLWTNATVGSVFESIVKRDPDKVCFYFGDQVWTYAQVDSLANRFASYFYNNGYRKGDRVALFMENRAEYVCIWLGLSKIGIISALINHHLRLEPLRHCVKSSASKAILYGYELQNAILEVVDEGGFPGQELYCFGAGGNMIRKHGVDLNTELKGVPEGLPKISEPLSVNDIILLVYTSGTTGLPKAAVIKHSRVMLLAYGVTIMNRLRQTDVLYSPLPLYHIQGGVVGVGQAILSGIPLVIVPKFSASKFWKDCIRYNVTISQYLGEICRFLLAQPPSAEDKLHKVRLMVGNGIRAEIWPEFLKRFNNPVMAEVYGATEGNCSLANIEGHVGAIGFVPTLIWPLIPQILVRIDGVTGNPIRDPKTGFVILCKVNEPGEMTGKILQNDPFREFEGYTDAASSEKKILRNAFKRGDAYFRTGDILVYDDYGYFYFKDRTGDTFRWKGENVSTTEVEGIISRLAGHKAVVVYGVSVPNTEGRAGMVAIADSEGSLDLKALSAGVMRELPSYARPVFLRTIPEISTTGTFKLQKMDLQQEAFDISKIKKGVYFLLNGLYVPLDPAPYSRILAGEVRI